MNAAMDMFSRTFNKDQFRSAWEQYQTLKQADPNTPQPQITSWALFDKSFKTSRARMARFTNEQLNKLEEAEGTANATLTNPEAVTNFINAATAVRSAIANKFPNEFVDPQILELSNTHATNW